MKKLYAIIYLMLSIWTGSLMAQTRKVAILETVDRQNQVTYGVKLMLRGYLAEAVTNTAGYEAYDRTDLNKILDEHEFQRTGLVSDEEIKKIGQMTGVQYILVAETGKMDEENMFITAKILNVETARVEMTTNVIAKIDVLSLQQGAKDLASHLLKVVDTPKSNKKVKEVVLEPQESAQKNEYIEKLRRNEFKCGDKWMTQREVNKYVYNRDLCYPAFLQFEKGKKLVTAAWPLTIIGGGLIIGGGVLCGYLDPRFTLEYWRPGIVDLVVGAAALTAGIVLFTYGIPLKNNAYKLYNEQCASKQTTPVITLNLQSSRNGLGLALQF